MKRKLHKGKRGGSGKHVQLPEWLQDSEAWRTLKPGPRALYVELKRRYNGYNNGEICLSHREAAKALNVNRNTVGSWFRELEKRGFIRMIEGAYLGPSGVGLTGKWVLTEAPLSDMKPARKDFMQWRNPEACPERQSTQR